LTGFTGFTGFIGCLLLGAGGVWPGTLRDGGLERDGRRGDEIDRIGRMRLVDRIDRMHLVDRIDGIDRIYRMHLVDRIDGIDRIYRIYRMLLVGGARWVGGDAPETGV
jgi:hypothetical protein